MLHFNERAWSKGEIPGLVTATADGLRFDAQTIRWLGDVYDIPETTIPIAYDGEPTRHAVYLTPDGLAHVAWPADEHEPEAPGAVCYLARLTLRAEGDTTETVDVEVVRRTCTTETPADVRRHTLPAEVVTPAETPERAARRAQRVRVDTLRRGIAQKPIAEMSLAELRWVVALMAETMGIDLGDGASAPKGRAP